MDAIPVRFGLFTPETISQGILPGQRRYRFMTLGPHVVLTVATSGGYGLVDAFDEVAHLISQLKVDFSLPEASSALRGQLAQDFPALLPAPPARSVLETLQPAPGSPLAALEEEEAAPTPQDDLLALHARIEAAERAGDMAALDGLLKELLARTPEITEAAQPTSALDRTFDELEKQMKR